MQHIAPSSLSLASFASTTASVAMKSQSRVFHLAMILLAGGISPVLAEDEKLSDPIIGTADTSGNLALHVFGSGARNPNIARLTTDYGIVMCHRKDGGALFVLGDRARKTVREFSNYERFVDALGELPPDSVITIYDRCLMPGFYDFYPVHFELYKKFKKDCAEKGLKIAKEPKLTCTCEEGK
jgi:hypothetical protein